MKKVILALLIISLVSMHSYGMKGTPLEMGNKIIPKPLAKQIFYFYLSSAPDYQDFLNRLKTLKLVCKGFKSLVNKPKDKSLPTTEKELMQQVLQHLIVDHDAIPTMITIMNYHHTCNLCNQKYATIKELTSHINNMHLN